MENFDQGAFMASLYIDYSSAATYKVRRRMEYI